jgi:YesN/AraC family two-component response regulator
VLEADCGVTAVEVADRHPGVIDLLLSDVVMPGINGRQVAQEITLRRPTTKVVFMSGYSDEALGARGILDPGTILLTKPFTGPALDRCLVKVLGRSVNAALRGGGHRAISGSRGTSAVGDAARMQ